jgi:hypothetical protein
MAISLEGISLVYLPPSTLTTYSLYTLSPLFVNVFRLADR